MSGIRICMAGLAIWIAALSAEVLGIRYDAPRHERTENFPSCTKVWRPDKFIPADYGGCMSAGVRLGSGAPVRCSDVDDRLVTYEEHWFGFAGGSTREARGAVLAADPQYLEYLSLCENGFPEED